MQIEELLGRLNKANIKITVAGENLKLSTASGNTIPSALLNDIKEHREAVINYIQKREQDKYRFESIPKVPEDERYEISHAQKRLLILAQFDEPLIAYNCFGSKILEGFVNIDILRKSFNVLIQRHESLRTVFYMDEGEFWQKIIDPANLSWQDFQTTYTDLQDDPEMADKLKNICGQYSGMAFRLDKLPLIKTGLFRIGKSEFVFLYSIHHLISDGWSSKVFFSELMHLYNCFSTGSDVYLQPLRIQYKDYSSWQNRLLKNKSFIKPYRDYWINRLQGAGKPLNLLPDFNRPEVKTYHGNVIQKLLPHELHNAIQALCLKSDNSMFTFLLATVKLLLFRYTNEEDIVIGTSVAGRDHPDLESQVGFYVNTLALRTRFLRTDTFYELLKKVNETVLEGLDHQLYPFDILVDELTIDRELSHSPLFDIKVVLQNTEDLTEIRDVKIETTIRDVIIKNYPADLHVSIYDISFRFTEHNDGIYTNIEYNTDLFTKERIEQMFSHFIFIVKQVLANSAIRLEEVSCLTPEEKSRLMDRYR